MIKFVLSIILLQTLASCCSEERNYLGTDIELWENTEAWEFAKYISKNQFEEAEQLIVQNHIDVDYREPKFGETLLSWAVLNDKVEAVKFLVNHGANPNSHNTYNGVSPIVEAAGGFSSIEILKYLLLHGGNPNDFVGEQEKLTHGRSIKTPLIAAAFISLEKTKMLVETGGDANFAIKPGYTSFCHAALAMKKDIIEYLLLNNKIDYKRTNIITLDTRDTLYLKELIKKDKVAYRQDSIMVKRVLTYIDEAIK
jgi:ankyrin repeat protein